MVVSIIANKAATSAQTSVTRNSEELSRGISRVSSGLRVFSADEDAAALSIGTGLKVNVSALRAAQINTTQASSQLQIADGALGQISDILIRMEALAASSTSGQFSNQERMFLDTEYQLMKNEIDRIVSNTEFNGNLLLGGVNQVALNATGANVGSAQGFVGFEFDSKVGNGDVFEVDFYAPTNVMTITNATQGITQTIAVSTPPIGFLNTYNFNDLGLKLTLNSDFDDTVDIVHAGAGEEFDATVLATATAKTLEFQVGYGTGAEDRIVVGLPLINLDQLGLLTSNVGTAVDAQTAIAEIRSAVNILNEARSEIGASMNRLDLAAQGLAVSIENAEAARSSLLDADVAAEVTNIASKQVLLEASVSMLSQANAQPNIYLQLLRNA